MIDLTCRTENNKFRSRKYRKAKQTPRNNQRGDLSFAFSGKYKTVYSNKYKSFVTSNST